jgi:carotenoid cleavage dioxygenase-like enzyme
MNVRGFPARVSVRPERKQEIESDGITISCLDKRGPRKHIEAVYHPKIVEDFSSTDGYELILECPVSNALLERAVGGLDEFRTSVAFRPDQPCSFV